MTTTSHTVSGLQTEAQSVLSYRVRLPVRGNPSKLLFSLHGVGGNEAMCHKGCCSSFLANFAKNGIN